MWQYLGTSLFEVWGHLTYILLTPSSDDCIYHKIWSGFLNTVVTISNITTISLIGLLKRKLYLRTCNAGISLLLFHLLSFYRSLIPPPLSWCTLMFISSCAAADLWFLHLCCTCWSFFPPIMSPQFISSLECQWTGVCIWHEEASLFLYQNGHCHTGTVQNKEKQVSLGKKINCREATDNTSTTSSFLCKTLFGHNHGIGPLSTFY